MKQQKQSDAAYQAFLSSARGWAEVDTEQFLSDNRASRDHASRPPVTLDDEAMVRDALETQQAVRAAKRAADDGLDEHR